MGLLTEIIHVLRESFGGHGVILIAIGVIAGAGLVGFLLWKFGLLMRLTEYPSLKEEMSQLKGSLKTMTMQCNQNTKVIEERAQELEKLKHSYAGLQNQLVVKVAEANTKLRSLKNARDLYKGAAEQHVKQLQAISQCDGRVWESNSTNAPEFRPQQMRRTAIISVLNLKGGVGKTTVAARLATLLAEKSQVLAIDLDFQHSLSDLCMSGERYEQVKKARRVIDRVFDASHPCTDHLIEAIQDCEGSSLHIVPSSEHLAEIEQKAMARWMVQPDASDPRFHLRSVLHDPLVSEKFDWIVLDCPPRLTTACVNAIAASDYVLIPVLLEATSASAVPRLLRWLRNWKTGSIGICPHLEILGVLPNKTRLTTRLTKTEQAVLSNLPDNCRDSWTIDVPFFKRTIWQSQQLSENAMKKRLVTTNDDLDAVFRDLVSQIQKKVPRDERIRA